MVHVDFSMSVKNWNAALELLFEKYRNWNSVGLAFEQPVTFWRIFFREVLHFDIFVENETVHIAAFSVDY